MVKTKRTSKAGSVKAPVKRMKVTADMRTRPPKCSPKMWDDKSKRIRPYRCTRTKTMLSPFQLNSDQLEKVNKL